MRLKILAVFLFAMILTAGDAFAGNTLYLKDGVAPSEAGAFAACATTRRGEQNRGTAAASSVTNSAASGTDIATTVLGGGSEICFVSDPLLAAVTIAGTVTANIWGFESAAQCNCTFRMKVAKWTSGGGEGAAFLDISAATELGTANAVRNFTGTPTSTAFAIGDRIVIRTRITNVGTMAGARTVTMKYAGPTAAADGDSYASFTEVLEFTRTRTVKTTGGDYTTFSAWEAGEQGDIVTLKEVRQAELYSMADTTAAVIDGWTTSATYYVRAFTPTSERHSGTYSTSKWRMEVDAGVAISTTEDFVRFDGLQIQNTGIAASRDGIVHSAGHASGSDIRISNTILKGVLSGTATGSAGIQALAPASGTSTVTIWNTIIYDWINGVTSNYGIYAEGGVTAYNVTVHNSYLGIQRNGGTFIAKNVIVNNSGSDGFIGTFDASSNYNSSDIAADAPGANSRNGVGVTFVDEAGDNFALGAADTEALGLGVDDPGSGLYADDIGGVTRTSPWSIGAWESDVSTKRRVVIALEQTPGNGIYAAGRR